MGAYFYSFKIISQYGHVKVLIAGLLGNVIRFIYISFITWPWLVLPFEFLQGITHAAVWAACCSFISHNTDAELRPSAQGVLQGIHHGFGRFCGAVFGGMLIKDHGTKIIFRIYGLVCAVVLVLFTLVNFYNMKEGGFKTDLGEDVDPRNVLEAEHLAPHGVPGGFKPRALSRRNSQEENQETVAQPDPMEDPAATNNPFLADTVYGATGAQQGADQGQYYGRGYTQAQSGYSASGLGY
jgi:MFS family permease